MLTVAITAAVLAFIAVIAWLAKESLIPKQQPPSAAGAVMHVPYLPTEKDEITLEPDHVLPPPLPRATAPLSPTPPLLPPHKTQAPQHRSQHATDTRHSSKNRTMPPVEHKRPRAKK